MTYNWRAPEFVEAWKRLLAGIATKRDAALVKQSLAIVVADRGPDETCALQRHEGRRRFAAELIEFAEEPDASSTAVDRRAGQGSDASGSGDDTARGRRSAASRRLGPGGEAGAA